MLLSKRFFFIFPLLLPVAFSLHAQDYKFSHFTVEQGLSQSVVNCILQDHRGFIWFGTQEGLNCYDGNNFTVFKRDADDSTSISNNFIYALCEDHNGVLWVGTNGGGLNALNPFTGKFTHYTNDPKNSNSLSSDIVRVIHESKDGKIWVGTDAGLNLLNPSSGKFTRYLNSPSNPHSLHSNRIFDIRENADGNLWIGTNGNGISLFNTRTFEFRNFPFPDDKFLLLYPAAVANDAKKKSQCQLVRSILPSGTDHLFIGTDGGGLQVFNTHTFTFEKVFFPDGTENKISNTRILSLNYGPGGELWIGTFGGGLDIISRKDSSIQHYMPNERDIFSISSQEIKCIYKDDRGNMWVGTNGQGVDACFSSTMLITHIRRSERPGVEDNTLMSSQILSVMEDHSGLLWIGTQNGGLTTYNRKTGKFTQHPELSTATNNSILSVFESRDSTIWVGTYGSGLNHFDPRSGKITKYSPENRLAEGTILSIAQDPSTGLIWFGTFGGGIYRLDPSTDSLTQFTVKSSKLSSDYIYTLFFDRQGNLWIGTRADGAMRYDRSTGKFIFFQHDDKDKSSLSNNIVYCIAQDENNVIWMSTGNGLDRFDAATGKFTTWYEHDGLPSDNIYAVIPDGSGNYWLSHNKGITRFTPGASGNDRFVNYTPPFGLQASEFNQGAYFINHTGEIFFGGQLGLNIIDPVKLKSGSPSPPPVYIVSYKRSGKEIRPDSGITNSHFISVMWHDNNFLFELSALDYTDPSRNLYRYKLEGLDEDWSNPSTNRYVSFTNLPGGDYKLHVRAAGSTGVWSEDRVLIRIHVEPPFWKTNWFYALCIIFIISGIFGFIRYRTAAIKKENRVLEAKVAERTQELAQKNADITSSIHYARRIQSAILPNLGVFSTHFPDSFVIYKPKDIVSGDFYWFGEKNGKKVIAVADCTGHGVPGALMSMMGNDLLNQIIIEKAITSPDEILDRLNEGVRVSLKQDKTDQDTADGMDIAIMSLDTTRNEILFAGALRPLIHIHKGIVNKIESDRFPIGGTHDTRNRKFTLHRLPVEEGDAFYLFSDGYADQFGGERGKKFMMKQLLESFHSVAAYSMHEQGKLLEKKFEEWKEGFQQVDDVLMIGIRV